MKFLLPLLASLICAPAFAQVPAAVISDPPINAAHPAALVPLVIPSDGQGMNAVLYTAAGAGLHPTLLLLHGFPGNEPNLDLAQAARRDGWNVLTFHYRGSWGSQGTFSLAHCLEDAANALAFLHNPQIAARYGIDTQHIAVAGHSMGGIMAARIGADNPWVIGTFLIDPADFAAIGRSFKDPKQRESFLEGEVRGDLPPLAGTSADAIMAETAKADPALDLVATMPKLADRPLALIGSQRGIGFMAEAAANAARKAGATRLVAETMPTDHSFSDMRIALAGKLISWLDQLSR